MITPVNHPMMQVIKYPLRNQWKELIHRPDLGVDTLEEKVKKILSQVKIKGDKALRQYTQKFDGVQLPHFSVSENEIREAESLLTTSLKSAIQQAKSNIEKFHRSQQEERKITEILPGIRCWRKSVAIEKVGIYIPGGTAPLFSTVLMLAVPATLAGCNEIILCTPPSTQGKVHPAILYTASLCGIRKIFKCGGAQAIAAMAWGTETIPKVFKIFGPGNRFVTCAKQLVQQQGTAIDLPAGPSEVLVIADDTALPEFIAADLLSQAEHGPDSQAILITTSRLMVKKVKNCLTQQLKNLPRKKIVKQALTHSKIILVHTLEEALDLANLYAPEHLILCCKNATAAAEKIVSAGSIFLGNYSPESAGDYASGTNHTLPTHGYAAMYSGVSLDSFVKKITFQQLTKNGLASIGNTVMEMAAAEGLAAHKNAIAIRLKK